MELKEMTFPQVLQLSIFQEELDRQMQREMDAWREAKRHGKVARMALTNLVEKRKFTMAEMTATYYHIMHKEATDYSANERQYIQDVCTIAYTATIRRLQQESRENQRNPLLRWWRMLAAWWQMKRNNMKKGDQA